MRLPFLFLSALLAACAPAPQSAGPAPAPVTTPSNAVLSRVPAVRVVRPGVAVPGTPPALNASVTVRYGPCPTQNHPAADAGVPGRCR